MTGLRAVTQHFSWYFAVSSFLSKYYYYQMSLSAKSAKPHRISDFLNQQRSLQHLLTEIRLQQQLLCLIQQKLPKKIAQHCYFATMQGPELCISVDSPVWGSQLRFASPELLGQLRKQMPAIGSIKVRTAPIQQNKTHTTVVKAPPRDCSEDTVEHLTHCAAYTPQGELRQALQRLAKTMQSRRQKQNG